MKIGVIYHRKWAWSQNFLWRSLPEPPFSLSWIHHWGCHAHDQLQNYWGEPERAPHWSWQRPTSRGMFVSMYSKFHFSLVPRLSVGVAKMRGRRRRAWYPLFAHALVCLGIPRLRLFLVHGSVTIRHQTTPLELSNSECVKTTSSRERCSTTTVHRNFYKQDFETRPGLSEPFLVSPRA